MARSGLGIRAIAARFFLSERTIESHLAHSYDKRSGLSPTRTFRHTGGRPLIADGSV